MNVSFTYEAAFNKYPYLTSTPAEQGERPPLTLQGERFRAPCTAGETEIKDGPVEPGHARIIIDTA